MDGTQIDESIVLGNILSGLDEDSGKAHIPSTWMQGRAAFGGLVAALAVRAARQKADDEKQLRSLLVTFAGPLKEQVWAKTNLLRETKNTSIIGVELSDDDGMGASANAIFGKSRNGLAIEQQCQANPTPLEALHAMRPAEPPMPSFLNNLEIRWANPGIPLTGSKEKKLSGWIRIKKPGSATPSEQLVLLADSTPPIIFSHYTHWVNGSSISWSLDLVNPNALDSGGWVYLDYHMLAAAEGFTQQRGYIYRQDGLLLAISQQTMTYFEPST